MSMNVSSWQSYPTTAITATHRTNPWRKSYEELTSVPSSSNLFETSNTDMKLAAMSQRLVSARCLPGHILEITTISDRGCKNGADYLRPKPKMTSNGFGRAASSKYLSGSNTSGCLQSRKMALRISFLKPFRRRNEIKTHYMFATTVVPAGIK